MATMVRLVASCLSSGRVYQGGELGVLFEFVNQGIPEVVADWPRAFFDGLSYPI